jgi:phosphoribosylglycinamide formyltransferase-1
MTSIFTLYLRDMEKHRLAIFASGQGSNAVNIMTYFKSHPLIEVAIVVTNNASAGVIAHAESFHVPVKVISNEEAANSDFLIKICSVAKCDLIILAGYLRMIPAEFAQAYDKKIINIHPSLLPKFGGKGMYGDRVHQAVIASGEKASGITVHFVNAAYDEGEIIGQASCTLESNETLKSLKQKISILERDNFPKLIEQTITGSHA